MGLRELKALVAVADAGSLTAAADVLHLSVPAVSAQIAALEASLGTVLFDRARKPARLNAAGGVVLPRAREILALYDRIGESGAESTDLAGRFSLGSIPTALTSVLPKALLSFRKDHPRMQITVHHGLSPSFADMLREGRIDAAIIREPREPLPELIWQVFTEEPVMVIAPRNARGDTDLALLRAYPYIRFSRHFWVAHRIEEALASRRVVLRESMELDSLEAIAMMVRYGLGVSIIPVSSASFLRFHRLRAVPLGKPPLKRKIGLAVRIGSPKARVSSAFFEALKKAALRVR